MARKLAPRSPAATGAAPAGAAVGPVVTATERRALSTDALHLVVLSAFAVAQPLLELLGRRPEFFAVRRSEPIDLWLLVALLCLAVPLPLVLLEAVADAVDGRLRRLVHGVFCAVLIAATLLPPLGALDIAPWIGLGLAVLAAAGCAVALDRWRSARQLLSFMSPALIVFPAAFLLRPGVGKILRPAEVATVHATDATTPIVLLVFDELPLISLLAGPNEIDAVRYPNFAALAAQATWYRHTATASDFTILAVPALLSGRLPDAAYLPIAPDYPQSLFTWLGDSYAMNVSESVTQLCPASLCVRDGWVEGLGGRMRTLASDLAILYLHVLLPDAWTGHLPPVNQNWMLFAEPDDWRSDWKRRQDGDRSEQVARFIDGIRPTEEPVLHMLHVLLPHPPFDHLPSGQRYSVRGHVVGLHNERLRGDPWAAVQNQQRHLLQLGYVDRLLGEIVTRLRDVGLWDRAVVVVTADHGVAFQTGGHNRKLDERNYAQILSVPLLVKAPVQLRGVLDERPASLIDVLPTIADLVGVDLPWPVDGTSLADSSARHRERFDFVQHRETMPEPGDVAVADVARSESAALARLDDRFGNSADGGRELFRFGEGASLIGRLAAELPVGPPTPFQYSLHLPTGALDVEPGDPVVPAHLTGRLVGGDVASPVRLAVAINGRIAAVTKSWDFAPASWSAVVDPEVFRAGVNSVALFAIESAPDPGSRVLRPVSPAVPAPLVGLEERGLHSTESWDIGTIRWTDGDAMVTVPVSASQPPRRLRLTIAGVKPGGGRLRVAVDGSPLLDVRLEAIARDDSWSTVLDLGGLDLGGEMTVEIVSDSFVPSEGSDHSADDRRLGVAVLGFELLHDDP